MSEKYCIKLDKKNLKASGVFTREVCGGFTIVKLDLEYDGIVDYQKIFDIFEKSRIDLERVTEL